MEGKTGRGGNAPQQKEPAKDKQQQGIDDGLRPEGYVLVAAVVEHATQVGEPRDGEDEKRQCHWHSQQLSGKAVVRGVHGRRRRRGGGRGVG